MFTIRIADTFIQINERYQYIKQYCRNYIVDDVTPEMVIEVSDEEIKAEQSDEYTSSPDYLETLAVYRKICERLVDKGIILVHSSALPILWLMGRLLCSLLRVERESQLTQDCGVRCMVTE